MPPNHVIIVGGGLAGPALAIALARHSVKSTILERTANVQDIGGVITLAPNAMCVMDKTLGLADKLAQKGSPFDTINLFLERGDTLEAIGGFVTRHHDRSAVGIARPVLHQTLVDECENMKDRIDTRFSSKLKTIEESSEGVEAILEDGTRVKGDVIIGADGIGSKVRAHVLDENIAPIYSGILTVGAVIPLSTLTLPPGMKLPAFCYTRHGTFLTFAMDDTSLQWATTLQIPEKDRKDGWEEYRRSGQAVADLKAKYSDMQQEPIRSLIDNLTNDNARLWAPYLIPSLEKWHSDRACILGDAAHAIPPSMGQGSAMAFEDVSLMARLLLKDEKPDYPALFNQFESIRRPRIDKIRTMTESAEATRRETGSDLWWWLKGTGTKYALWLMGKDGYLKNDAVSGFDITSVPI